MKAKDLTQADVGKWVTLRARIFNVRDTEHWVSLEFQGDINPDINYQSIVAVYPDTILEFTTPPPPVQEVGDVFRFIGNGAEWTISMVDGSACLLRYLTGHISADYPLNPDLWEFVRKGTVA